MQTLSLLKVKAACRKAYRDHRLLAQHRDPLKKIQEYGSAIGEYRCAIGAALTARTLRMVNDQTELEPWKRWAS